MDLNKSGQLLFNLRKAKGMTQKEVADRLNICPKTVSKWETGHGFPDISTVSRLANILGVSSDALLAGSISTNPADSGNMKKTKFFVCPECSSFITVTGEARAICCSKQLETLTPRLPDGQHEFEVSISDNELYIEFNHEMTKEHYISFISYVTTDKIITVKLYPEQTCEVRFPLIFGGKFYYYCTRHGLFEYLPKIK